MSGPERSKVISAIKTLGRRVTAADVSAKTGLPLLATVTQLNSVAADCGATLEVSPQGDLVYKFAPAFESAYLKTGVARFFQAIRDKSFQVGYFLLRTSFGVMLIASVITVSVLVIVAMLALLSKSNDSGGGDSGGSGGFDFDLSFLADIGRFFVWDLSYPRTTYGTIAPSYEDQYLAYTRGQYTAPGSDKKPNQGFILNCYSYLFGDGNPNEHIEETKWHLVAEHIRRNNGVTTAEELACYTGANPKREEEALPVLVRFNGVPQVTERGHIIYTFPSLQVTATDSQAAAEFPAYLEEKRWEFSEQAPENFVAVAVFACLNFIGCMWLLGHISKVAVLHPFGVLIDFLSVYAAFFLFFPIIRYFALQFINGKTALRNGKRKKNWKHLKTKQAQSKIIAAKEFAVAPQQIADDQIVYTTEKDALEQEF